MKMLRGQILEMEQIMALLDYRADCLDELKKEVPTWAKAGEDVLLDGVIPEEGVSFVWDDE